MRKFIVGLGAFALVLLVGWLGFVIRPRPFPPFAEGQPPLETVPLPEGLPKPVERFYRRIYGDRVPVIRTAVVSGRASLEVGGLKIPARFRFAHEAGQNYRHYFELTWFGQTFGTGNEHYLDGKSRLVLPFGLSDEGPQVDQAANLSMWAEYAWLPAVLLTDPRVRWEAVDDNMALLVVPFEEQEERFGVRFDPVTGRLVGLEAMRYKDSKNNTKILWSNETTDWQHIGGYEVPATGTVTWFDEGKPWAVFTAEDIALNADVAEYIREGQK